MIVLFTCICKFWCIDVRLINGTDATEGIIEINEDGRWVVLCTRYGFREWGATVMCRQLRFGLPIHYYESFIENSAVYYAYIYFFIRYNPCKDAERFSHCFNYFYGNSESCYNIFLKCSST